jgi:hypothetical protein
MRTALNGAILVEAMDVGAAEPNDIDKIFDALRRLGRMDADQGSAKVEAVVPPGSPKELQRVRMHKRIVRFRRGALRLEDLPPAD